MTRFSVTAQNPVSKKDLKKLKSDILEQYPRLTESDIKKVPSTYRIQHKWDSIIGIPNFVR